MAFISAQLGHADMRMTVRHYAHLAPDLLAKTIRAELPPLAAFEPGNVVSFSTGGRG